MLDKWIKRGLTGALLMTGLWGAAWGQSPFYTVKAIMDTVPSGPNQTVDVRVVFEPHEDLSGYQLMVGFDDSRVSLDAVEDNLGPAGEFADAVLTLGPIEALSGVTYANVYRKIMLDTAATLYAPLDPNEAFNIGLLKFTTGPTYDPGNEHFGVYLDVDPPAAPYGVWDANLQLVEVQFVSLPPSAAVLDWSTY